jgi:hypothetical protein
MVSRAFQQSKNGGIMKTFYRNVCTNMIALLFILLLSFTAMAAPPQSSVPEAGVPAGVAAQGAAVTVNVSPAIADTGQKAAEKSVHWEAPPQWVVFTVIGVVVCGSFLAMLSIRAALGNTNWNLGNALSEDVEISNVTTNAEGKEEVKLDAGKPTTVIVMRASISRLIAFMGMMVILFIFIGFGVFALYSFAFTGEMPDSTDKVIQFLAGGLTLFAPYLVNKFAGIFENFSSKAKRLES